ncbi:hypothetical protein H5159_16560 [Pseudoalteromonas sp. SG43-1]|jgi:hypothetical protein|uniref:hypothetical protein n=1 Tax=Pseudoalteromonas sp. SG43-1 TaxID=2760971 RepID=UPI001603682E|nr:hypothetical protein [Pseudoalteromonas sp. SG43-1]MBB1452656.1 hypothetical protein [Pseudoalteromonas sp. SG43-1]
MTLKSDPLTVLLKLNSKLNLALDEQLIKDCYQVQKDHQYDKDRNTLDKVKAIVEETVVEKQGNKLI